MNSAVDRLRNEAPDFWSTTIPPKLLSKIAEFVVWHTVLEGIQIFKERHVYNTQQYEWLNSTSMPGVDIYGAMFVDNQWCFAVVEIKWSEVCAYSQITSTSQGLVHDLKKLFEGQPSNRLVTKLTALKAYLRRHSDCRDALEGLRSVVVGLGPASTQGVAFVGFFVGDVKKASDSNGFDKAYESFHKTAKKWGWSRPQLHTYVITGSPLEEMLEQIARGGI